MQCPKCNRILEQKKIFGENKGNKPIVTEEVCKCKCCDKPKQTKG